jgi:hypothetical protein
MANARYMVRRQENGKYCIWEGKTDKPAEADGQCYVNLHFDEAIDRAISLNKDRNPD